jgi:putative transposase
MVFYEFAMPALFLAYIKLVKKRHSAAIYNFCIMRNHIHFAIRPGRDSSLSKIMQWLLGNYAKAWNKAHGVKGHLWGDRFFSKVIRGREAFRHVFDYISRNPVKAGLVGRPDEWEYGGVCHFIKGETAIISVPPWMEAEYQAFAATGNIDLNNNF